MNTETDYEQWARLLLTRKVPQNSQHLIDSETVHSGAEILKEGGAFEVHIEGLSAMDAQARRVYVTPMPSLMHH